MILRKFADHFRRHDWFAVVVDFSVVVLGIFVAVQVNNWNQSRIDKAEEKLLLSALAEDFSENAEILVEVTRNHNSVADAGQAIITYGEVGMVPEEDRDQFELYLSNHGSRFKFNPVMGAVENILATDKIDLIRSRDLIAQLRRWPQLVAELNDEENASRDHFQERIYPFLASRIDFEDLDKGFQQCCFDDPETGEIKINRMRYPWEQLPSNAYLLVEDQEFLSLIYWHWVHSLNILRTLREVEASMQTIRQAVDQELSL